MPSDVFLVPYFSLNKGQFTLKYYVITEGGGLRLITHNVMVLQNHCVKLIALYCEQSLIWLFYDYLPKISQLIHIILAINIFCNHIGKFLEMCFHVEILVMVMKMLLYFFLFKYLFSHLHEGQLKIISRRNITIKAPISSNISNVKCAAVIKGAHMLATSQQ